MNNAATDGGGGSGGVSSYVVDHETLSRVAERLGTAGSDLDATGAARPSGAGTGRAEPLLLIMLAAASEAAGRMSFDSTALAAAVEDCNVQAGTVDSEAAASFLVTGAEPG
ncbi:MAG: hypothetical protein LH468_03535 [Nocardioides sp.]|nr:hypothetical protein [Nocardioides sp.]